VASPKLRAEIGSLGYIRLFRLFRMSDPIRLISPKSPNSVIGNIEVRQPQIGRNWKLGISKVWSIDLVRLYRTSYSSSSLHHPKSLIAY
jgi:hypothetical protein